MRIYVLIFFLLCPTASMAMEIEEKAPEKGIVIEEATALLRRHARVYVLEDGTIKILFYGFVAADFLFTIFPGLILSVPFSTGQCPKVFGEYQNGSFVTVENSTVFINGTNIVDKDAPALCYFGLGALSIPIVSYLSTLFIYPLGKIYQSWALWMNRRIEEKIDREFGKNRLKDEILDDEDIRHIGKLLLKDRYLLGKLSLNQSLILAEIDLNMFREENGNFSRLAQQYAQKLLRFLEMGKEEFITECANEKVHEIFRKYPSLWQALARILFKEHGKDKMILSALKEALRNSLTFKVDNLHLDMIFLSIVKKGHSIHEIILKEVFVEKYHKDSKIKIIHGTKEWDISKNRLIEISDFFKVATTKSWRRKKTTPSPETDSSIPLLDEHFDTQNDQIDLSFDDIELVKVLIDVALNNTVKITKDTIITFLDAADYFAMPDLVIRCDNFIKENNLSEEIFQVYEPEKSIEVKLAFCKKFGLLENYRALIMHTKNRLDNININDLSVLDDIELLNIEEKTELAKVYKEKEFRKKFQDPKFLNVIWARAKTIAFLNTTIVKFCGNDSNKDIVEKAWVTMPDDLEAAITNTLE